MIDHNKRVMALVIEATYVAIADVMEMTYADVKADAEIVEFVTRWTNDPATWGDKALDYSVRSLFGYAYFDIAETIKVRCNAGLALHFPQ